MNDGNSSPTVAVDSKRLVTESKSADDVTVEWKQQCPTKNVSDSQIVKKVSKDKTKRKRCKSEGKGQTKDKSAEVKDNHKVKSGKGEICDQNQNMVSTLKKTEFLVSDQFLVTNVKLIMIRLTLSINIYQCDAGIQRLFIFR